MIRWEPILEVDNVKTQMSIRGNSASLKLKRSTHSVEQEYVNVRTVKKWHQNKEYH